MISDLALVAAIGVLFYALLPAASLAVLGTLRRRYSEALSGGTELRCTGAGIACILAREAESGTERRLSPADTTFLLKTREGRLERLPANRLGLLIPGTVLRAAPHPFLRRRTLCALGYPAQESVPPAPDRPPAASEDPVRYLWAAIGVFLEFALFVSWLGNTESPLPAVAALVGIFGKALPWCPPGLFLTLRAHLLASQRDSGDKKKDRRRRAVGHLLIAVGVLVNLAAVFFGISRTGWFVF